MIRDISPSALYMGVLAAFVGYAASFAIVLAGLTSMGADPGQAATGLFFATLGMGICSILVPALTRVPAAIAWSTPGGALLAATAVLPGGFAEAVGALVACALLILLTGLIPVLARWVAAIPRQIASALLAGVLLKLCFAPALAFETDPLGAFVLVAAWVAGLAWHRLAAMPLTVAAFLLVLAFGSDMPLASISTGEGWLPAFQAIMPVFTLQGFVSVAIPLFLVTMAGQNIPGFALLELRNYRIDRKRLLRDTGFASLLIAPFGAVPMNMSAITAAMMSGEDAGPDPARRYWAAISSGIVYAALAFAAGPVVALVNQAPMELILAVAGLALIPAFAASLAGTVGEAGQIGISAALTFIVTASGMSLFGLSGAFWGVVAGLLLWFVTRARTGRAG
ncbi:MAG: benzoate/H(+) symporter BenE family transporter [Geminicoccaceae bacterium]